MQLWRAQTDQLAILREIAAWCAEIGIAFNIKTKVCQLNMDEDMNNYISTSRPYQWEYSRVPVDAR